MNARRLALLGLNVPLSAIMLAVLGIWPEDDEEPPVVDPGAVQSLGGGGVESAAPRASRRKQADWREIEEDDDLDRARRERDLEKQARRNMAIMLATVMAVATEGCL